MYEVRLLKDMRCSASGVAYSQLLCPYLISFLLGAVASLSSCSALISMDGLVCTGAVALQRKRI